MIFGALVVARRVPRHLLALGVLFATLVQGAGLGLPTAWPVVAFAAAMWFIGGTGHGTKNTLARTLIEERVPDRLHGRAFAAYNAMRNGAELFALACGASSSQPSADAPRSRSRAAYPWRWRSPGSCSTAARRPPAAPNPSRPTDGIVLSTGVIHSCGLGWAQDLARCDAPGTCAAVSRR
jgi:hypothetical protein